LPGGSAAPDTRASRIDGAKAKARGKYGRSRLLWPHDAVEPGAFTETDRLGGAAVGGDDDDGSVCAALRTAELIRVRRHRPCRCDAGQADQKNESRKRRHAHYTNHTIPRVHSRQATVPGRIIDGCTRSI
jgi:hypothetical protein